MTGVFGTITQSTRDLFQDLWVVSSLRGKDSSGVAFINPQNHVKILKEIGTPFNLLNTKNFDKINRKKHICVIGHNRFATIGEVNLEMAHPHQIKNIVGTHNGTLRNQHLLVDKTEYDSDSKQLFSSIQNKGLLETWRNVDGAAAIVWWDSDDKTLNMIRNSTRSLFFVFIGGDKEKSAIAWASEAWMLEHTAKRKNIVIGTIWRPIIDTHYKFSYKNMVSYKSNKIKPFSHAFCLNLLKDYKWPNAGKRWDSNLRRWVKFEKNKDSQCSSAYYDMKNNQKKSAIFLNKNISEEEFLKKYKICDFCNGDLDESAYVSSILIDTKTVVCATCVLDIETKGVYFNIR